MRVTPENLSTEKPLALNKLGWLYRAGDNPNNDSSWAQRDFNDGAWERIAESRLDYDALPRDGWRGRAWFRLHLNVDEQLADKNLALVGRQFGASEIYLDGQLLTRFGQINDAGEAEYNPARLPIPFMFDRAGEHVLAVRYSLSALRDASQGRGAWLRRAGFRPGFSFEIQAANDLNATIREYAVGTSMRGGFMFAGILFALALLHFLLFAFYRVERANLFYSIYAAAFAINIMCGNLLAYGHQGMISNVILNSTAATMLSTSFVALLAFLHVAFRRPLGWIFWTLAAMWMLNAVLRITAITSAGNFNLLPNIAITLTFTFSIYLLVQALREKRAGAWILMGGVQLFALGMLSVLFKQLSILKLPLIVFEIGELFAILAVPIAVSVFLARNFARTNQDLEAQLTNVKTLSIKQLEQERQAAELKLENQRTRAENERRAKELDEARQLQISMLPRSVPQLPHLDIAAFMKPATEVGGDYYDFHVGEDGTLTVAIGDATGHGLKAGTVVTATKSLFNNLAPEPDIIKTLNQFNCALKDMNLRGLFMALALVKIKGDKLAVGAAGMPPMLVFRAANGVIEEVHLKGVPLGSLRGYSYKQTELDLAHGDVIVLMSDGFPERFNDAGEMIEYDKAKEVLRDAANLTAQEIINRFVAYGDEWAGARAQDDDVTFVVLKVTGSVWD